MEVLASRVLVSARDLDRSLAFYEGGLGLHRFREFGQPPHRGVVLFLAGGYLELTQRSAGAPSAPPPGVRLWLQVRDLAGSLEELGARGVQAAEPAERKPWGLIEAIVHDPDGLPLVLVEVPAEHPMRRDIR